MYPVLLARTLRLQPPVAVLENVHGLGRVRGKVTRALRRCGKYVIAWLNIQPLMLTTPFRRGRWYLCMAHQLEP